MNILKIGSGVERTSNLNEYNKVSTNPFANTNFRGNVLPFVDVFESAKKAGTGLNIKNKTPDEQGFYEFKLNKYDEFENGVKLDDEYNLNQFKLALF